MDVNVIYNEDCFDTFKRIDDKSIDMVLCDLPYGITACKWDSVIPLEPLWREYKRIIKDNGAIVLTASQPFTSRLVMSNPEMFKYELIWNKMQGKQPMLAHKRIMKAHENILVFYSSHPTYNPQMQDGVEYSDRRTKSNYSIHRGHTRPREKQYKGRYPISVFPFMQVNTPGQHPTQKPIALFEYLIKTYTNEGDLVLDNCIGSGTTAVACINLNRHYIGCELDKGYYDIAIQRIKEHERKP